MLIRILTIMSLVVSIPAMAVDRQGLDAAIAQFDEKETAKARQSFDGIWMSDPTNAEAAWYLGRLDFDEQKLKEATGWFEKATELDPGDSRYFLWLGHGKGNQAQEASIFSAMGLAKDCLAAYERALELDPSSVEVRNSLADYYLGAPAIAGGGVDKAQLQADALMKIDKAAAYSLQARIYMEDEKFELAEGTLRRALKEDPESKDAYFRLGYLYQQRESWDSAFETFEKAYVKFDSDPGALYQIGRTSAFSGERLVRGQECLELYIGLPATPNGPSEAGARWRLGLIYEKSSDYEAAVAQYEKALSLEPDFKEAKGALKAAKKKLR